MEGKKSFILYCDIITTIEKLSDEQAGQLFKIILQYVNDKNPEVRDLLLQIAFEPIRNQLKRDLIKWSEERHQRSEAGKKGMKERWKNKRKTKDNTVINPITTDNKNNTVINPITNITDNVTVTVTDNVTDNENGNVKKKKGIDIFKKPSIIEIKEYCTGRNNKVDAESFFDFYESKGWLIGKNKMKDWQAAVRTWERNNYNQTKKNEHKSDLEPIVSSRWKPGDARVPV